MSLSDIRLQIKRLRNIPPHEPILPNVSGLTRKQVNSRKTAIKAELAQLEQEKRTIEEEIPEKYGYLFVYIPEWVDLHNQINALGRELRALSLRIKEIEAMELLGGGDVCPL